MSVKNIVCIGAGYVGGPTMAVIADRSPEIKVTVVDLNEERIGQWNSDSLPVFEPGLHEVVMRRRGKNLFFQVVTPEILKEADIIFVSVNTPTKDYGHGAGMAADLRFWEKSARDILQHAKNGAIVVEKSTVPVKTAQAISRILHSGNEGKKFQVLSNPEFLAEGTAIKDLEEPDRVLIGGENSDEGRKAAENLAAVYAHWIPRERIVLTNVWSSELSKLIANAMLAQRVSSINAVSALCEKTNADVKEISKAVGLDDRIGKRFLDAGVGFGGSCFRKDILNLSYVCETYGLHEVASYWKQVVDMNDYQMDRFVRMVVENQFNTVAGKKIAIFGFAFKPDTNDTRDTPALPVSLGLLEERAHLTIHDPKALEEAKHDLRGAENVIFEPDPYKAAEGAHALVFITHWKEFKELDYKRIYESMEKPAFIFDGRIFLDHKALFEMGFNVFSIGKQGLAHFK